MADPNLTFEQWFENITKVHGIPCYVLVRLDPDGIIKLIGVASNSQSLPILLNTKKADWEVSGRPSYVG